MNKPRRDTDLASEIGKRLRKVRQQKNLSQEAVGGDTRLNIARIESGRHIPSLTTCKILSSYYEIGLGDLFRDL